MPKSLSVELKCPYLNYGLINSWAWEVKIKITKRITYEKLSISCSSYYL